MHEFFICNEGEFLFHKSYAFHKLVKAKINIDYNLIEPRNQMFEQIKLN